MKLTYTNTSLSTARRCPREFELGYLQRLVPIAFEREALDVGSAWHEAHDVETKGGDPYDALNKHAPGALWAEKLRRLFAAAGWYWNDEKLHIEEAEHTFCVELEGVTFEGQIDGIMRLPDGRRGILERKTSGEDISDGTTFWSRLRMGTQVGIYAAACGFLPDFIMYDVVRKPTINPKRIAKAEATRLRGELTKLGQANYYQELFGPEDIEAALADGRETISMYGARLTADIGDQPDKYFRRKEIPRTVSDIGTLLDNLAQQVQVIEHARENGLLFRNTDACTAFGTCRFFGLCSNNVPVDANTVPDGYTRRDALHPELA